MENNWVNFKAIKQAVTITQVLDRYGITQKLKRVGKELRGRCPIHKGEGVAFHANTEKNAFHCFSCHAKGNVLDLVAAMEQCGVRDAGLKLQQWFRVAADGGALQGPASAVTPADESQPVPEKLGERGEPNKPLGFQLKGIDHTHPYLAQRGIQKETAESFGVGYFSGKGSMFGRVVIPIHNEHGDLVAYAGRAIDGTGPRYKLPAGFRKAVELYNLHRAIETPQGGLIVVEGFFDAMKVSQAGYPFVVALMGCSLSEEQERLLVDRAGMVLLMFDGDEAGQRITEECLLRLGRKAWVKAVTVPAGKQPDQLSTEELQSLLCVG